MKREDDLWNEFQNVLSTYESLEDLLVKLVEVVRRNKRLLRKKADLNFLEYILNINIENYKIGTAGHDFDRIIESYVLKKEIKVEEIWRDISQLIWDLIVPVTKKICPRCQCDHLVLLYDFSTLGLYESCENCFYTERDEEEVERKGTLFPATKEVLIEYNRIDELKN